MTIQFIYLMTLPNSKQGYTCYIDKLYLNLNYSVLTCPAPRDLDKISIWNYIKEFIRKLKCRAYFYLASGGSGQQLSRVGPFREKSS